MNRTRQDRLPNKLPGYLLGKNIKRGWVMEDEWYNNLHPTTIVASLILALSLVLSGFLIGGVYEVTSTPQAGVVYKHNRLTGELWLCHPLTTDVRRQIICQKKN